MSISSKRASLFWGSVLLVVGLIGAYVFGYVPWRDGANHEPKVTLSMQVVLVTPLFILIGGLMLLPMKPLPPVAPVENAEPPTPLRAKIFIALLVLGEVGAFIFYFWLRNLLRHEGYDL